LLLSSPSNQSDFMRRPWPYWRCAPEG
jgi:hypothetical protein